MIPLTLNKPKGNASTNEALPGWEHAQKLNAAYGSDENGVLGRRGPWVKGHIIHHNLGGDGMRLDNLFIIDRSANAEMSVGESLVQKELKTLAKITDPKHEDYNKVLYYSVTYELCGSSEPLSAFAKEGRIKYGKMDADGSNRSSEEVRFKSSQPSESTSEITIDLNGLGRENLNRFFKDKGMKPSYAQYLAKILKKGRYNNINRLIRNLNNEQNISEHNSPKVRISRKTILKQTTLLKGWVGRDLKFKMN